MENNNFYSGKSYPSDSGYSKHDGYSKHGGCAKDAKHHQDRGVKSEQQIPITDATLPVVAAQGIDRAKFPVVLAERTLQIAVESDISLYPPASEIKRVKKHVFLDQVKLVPVEFAPIGTTGYSLVTRAKLFVAGHIRKNIQYASAEYNAPLQDRIAKVRFSGFAELLAADFENFPVIGTSSSTEANFLNEKTEIDARLDKYFFQNIVRYNEQPYGELVAAEFYELDFSPESTYKDGAFDKLREKIVLDLSLKVLQVQQVAIAGTGLVPNLGTTNLPPGVAGAGAAQEETDEE